eukprot:5064777-Pyramimonas_sp.AAC.1
MRNGPEEGPRKYCEMDWALSGQTPRRAQKSNAEVTRGPKRAQECAKMAHGSLATLTGGSLDQLQDGPRQ